MEIETIKGLKKYQEGKRQESREKIQKAIEELQKENLAVNFKSVSEKSGISRKTLYKVEEFQNLIKKCRGDKNEDFYKREIADKALEIEKLQQELEALKHKAESGDSLKDNLASLKEALLKRST